MCTQDLKQNQQRLLPSSSTNLLGDTTIPSPSPSPSRLHHHRRQANQRSKSSHKRQPVTISTMDPRRRYDVDLPPHLLPDKVWYSTDHLLPPGVSPLWKQRLYSPSSTPPPVHPPSAAEIAYYKNKLTFPSGNPEPHFDPVLSACWIVCKHLNKHHLGVEDPGASLRKFGPLIIPKDDDEMDALRRGMQRVGIRETRDTIDPEFDIEEDEYTIPLDGDHREHARTLMLKMLSKGIGAMHKDKIQRANEMINDCMLLPWDEVVGITLWNLSRTNPFFHQTPTTRYLDGLFEGFRRTWIRVCVKNQGKIDFAEAVCRYLFKTQSQLAQMGLDILNLHAKTFFLTSHGFWLYGYRLYRESIGYPLGVHCEHTLMDREKTPKMLVDYTLALLNNENFDTTDEKVDLPMEIVDAAGACIKTLSQVFDNEESNEHNKSLIDHFARNFFSASRQRLINYCRVATQCLAFDDVV
ncbi:hypothetical protein TWF718_003349 [Orbilia javanica]|uniref:Uncharacterized protein n=1 Tax=Orbilia javanica TaxID=47235 RepID=A0AAN8RBA4_9PEZI